MIVGALSEKDRNVRLQNTGRVPFEERVPRLDFGWPFDGQEMLFERLSGSLPLDEIERTLDAFASQAINRGCRAWIDDVVNGRPVHAMPRP